MGGCCTTPEVREEEVDLRILGDFLDNKENLKTIWNQFNRDQNAVLDKAEFDSLLYAALTIFMRERDPNGNQPEKSHLERYVDTLRNELAPRVDSDGDGYISYEEFKTFGEYLKREYEKVKQNS